MQSSDSEVTFELRHHVVQVVLQLVVGGELEAHVVLGDSGERLGRIDASLVQDAVDAESCGGKNESTGV